MKICLEPCFLALLSGSLHSGSFGTPGRSLARPLIQEGLHKNIATYLLMVFVKFTNTSFRGPKRPQKTFGGLNYMYASNFKLVKLCIKYQIGTILPSAVFSTGFP